MSQTALAVVQHQAGNEASNQTGDQTSLRIRDQIGASTAEYATVTGCGVGFAAVLFKFLNSSAGQGLIEGIFDAVKGLLPF